MRGMYRSKALSSWIGVAYATVESPADESHCWFERRGGTEEIRANIDAVVCEILMTVHAISQYS
jgi:hypothetical protein